MHTLNEVALADLLEERVRALIDNDSLPPAPTLAKFQLIRPGSDQMAQVDRAVADLRGRARKIGIAKILAAVSPTEDAQLSAIRMALKICAARYEEALAAEVAA